MSRKAVSMRKAREILRLRHEAGLSVRQIAGSLRVSHGTVVNYLRRAEASGLGWPLAAEVGEPRAGGASVFLPEDCAGGAASTSCDGGDPQGVTGPAAQ